MNKYLLSIRRHYRWGLVVAVIALGAWFASPLPDGLESAAAALGIEEAPAMLPELLTYDGGRGWLSGLLGVAAVYLLVRLVGLRGTTSAVPRE